jgi:hypothetical protein
LRITTLDNQRLGRIAAIFQLVNPRRLAILLATAIAAIALISKIIYCALYVDIQNVVGALSVLFISSRRAFHDVYMARKMSVFWQSVLKT